MVMSNIIRGKHIFAQNIGLRISKNLVKKQFEINLILDSFERINEKIVTFIVKFRFNP